MITTLLLKGTKTKCRDLHKAFTKVSEVWSLFLSPTGVVVHLGVCSVQTGGQVVRSL